MYLFRSLAKNLTLDFRVWPTSSLWLYKGGVCVCVCVSDMHWTTLSLVHHQQHIYHIRGEES